MLLLPFFVLLLLWAKPRKPGVISGLFLSLYAVVRIIGEQFRMPDIQIGFQALGLTRGQWLSVAVLLAGILWLWLALKRNTAPVGGWRMQK